MRSLRQCCIHFILTAFELQEIKKTMIDTSRESIEQRVVELFVRTTKLDVAQFRPELLLADTGIDSLGLVELIFAIEDEYDISIPFNANEQGRQGRSAAAFESVGQLMDQVVGLVQAKQSDPAVAA